MNGRWEKVAAVANFKLLSPDGDKKAGQTRRLHVDRFLLMQSRIQA